MLFHCSKQIKKLKPHNQPPSCYIDEYCNFILYSINKLNDEFGLDLFRLESAMRWWDENDFKAQGSVGTAAAAWPPEGERLIW